MPMALQQWRIVEYLLQSFDVQKKKECKLSQESPGWSTSEHLCKGWLWTWSVHMEPVRARAHWHTFPTTWVHATLTEAEFLEGKTGIGGNNNNNINKNLTYYICITLQDDKEVICNAHYRQEEKKQSHMPHAPQFRELLPGITCEQNKEFNNPW